jgi:hypothetical protein
MRHAENIAMQRLPVGLSDFMQVLEKNITTWTNSGKVFTP